MKMLKTVLIDVVRKTVEDVEVKDDLDAFYEKLNCSMVEITSLMIGGVWYDIMCDEEGLLKNQPIVSAVQLETLDPMLVGNLMFFNYDGRGNLVSLDDTDIERIKDNIVIAFDRNGGISPCVLIG